MASATPASLSHVHLHTSHAQSGCLVLLVMDMVLGSIPFIGPGIDFFYRAHTKNLELLRQRDVWTARTSDWLVVTGAGVLFLIALSLPIILLVLLIRSF